MTFPHDLQAFFLSYCLRVLLCLTEPIATVSMRPAPRHVSETRAIRTCGARFASTLRPHCATHAHGSLDLVFLPFHLCRGSGTALTLNRRCPRPPPPAGVGLSFLGHLSADAGTAFSVSPPHSQHSGHFDPSLTVSLQKGGPRGGLREARAWVPPSASPDVGFRCCAYTGIMGETHADHPAHPCPGLVLSRG